MSGSPKLCAVVLAAGASSRMGRDKALLPWPPSSQTGTLLSAAICALRPFAQIVFVVAGHNEAVLAPVANARGAILVRNPAPERGQFSSLQAGLREALAFGCDAVMITPVDCPPLSASSLELLRAGFESAVVRGLWAVAPENGGRHGHPLLASRELIDVFLAAPATENARELLHAHAQRVGYIPVSDALVKAGLNTPEDYAALAKKT